MVLQEGRRPRNLGCPGEGTVRHTVQIFPLGGPSTPCSYTVICAHHGLPGPHILAPTPPLAHLLPPCPPCTSPAFLWCFEHARTLQPQGLCTCRSPNRSAFLNLHGIESLALSKPQFKCRLIRKAFHGHPVLAAACPCPCPDPHSLCSLNPSVFLPSISLT